MTIYRIITSSPLIRVVDVHTGLRPPVPYSPYSFSDTKRVVLQWNAVE